MSPATPDIQLAVAILVRDAAEPLRLTLASVREVAHQIVVIDSGSTDRTVDVAREFGARVVPVPWSDDFSAARNVAFQHLAGDWILWLDAGESLSDAEARGLADFLAGPAKRDIAYACLVTVPPIDPQAAEEQIARVRLLPNVPGLAYTGRVRESLTASLSKVGLQVEGAPIVIRRGEREHDTRLKKQRATRNMRLAEREQSESGPSARLENCFGDARQTLGDNAGAAEHFRQALSLAERGSADHLEACYGLLTSLDATESTRHAQLTHCLEALEVFPLDAQLLCALGGYLHQHSQPALSQRAYLTAYKYGQVQPLVWHVADVRDIAATCYSVALQLAGQDDESCQFLEQAATEHSQSIRIRRRLIDLYILRGDREAALAHVTALPKNTPHIEALRSAVRGASYAAKQNWIAAKAYLNAAFAHGCRDPLCLKWLSLTLMATGDRDAARVALEQWQMVEPRNADAARLLAQLAAAESASGKQLRVDEAAGAPRPATLPLFGPVSAPDRTTAGP